jgi:capsular exopolysaccharide synthesis family protein
MPGAPVAGGQVPPVTTLPKLTPKALLQALRRRWLAAVTLGSLAAALVGGIAWLILPNVLPPAKHTVQTLLHVLPTPVPILFKGVDNPGDFLSSQQTQAAMVRSRLVLTAALRNTKVANLPVIRDQFDPAEWLEKQIRADFSISPEIMKISMVGDNPDDLVVILKAVTEAYMEEIVDKERNKRRERLSNLKNLHSLYQERLRVKRNELRDMTIVDAGGNDPEAFALFQKSVAEQAGDLRKQKLQNDTKLRGLRTDLLLQKARERAMQGAIFPIGATDLTVQSLAAQAAPPLGVPLGELMQRVASLAVMELDRFSLSIPPDMLEKLVAKDPNYGKLKTRLDEKEREIALTLEVVTKGENDPKVKELRLEVAKTKRLMDERRLALLPTLTQLARLRVQAEVRSGIQDLRDKIGWYVELGEVLENDLKQKEALIKKKAGERFDLVWLTKEIASQEKIAQNAADQAAALEVEIDAPARTKLLQEPVIVFAPPGQREALYSGLAGAGAMGLVLFLIGFLDFRARRVNTINEVISDLGMPVVGTVPTFANPDRRGFASGNGKSKQQHSLLTESVDATRTMLLHAAQTQSLRVLMITSALQGEGKTSLASHLALSMVRAGFKTLLIDCDLRRPTADRLFNVPLEPGFCELLRGESQPSLVVRSSPLSGLDVVTAGRFDRHVARPLAQGQSRVIFDQLKQQYDCVIIDSAPLLPVVDSLLLAQQVDAVLLSVLSGVSRQLAIQAAYQRLQTLGVRVLGAVVNGAAEGDHYYYHHYYYAPTPAPVEAPK